MPLRLYASVNFSVPHVILSQSVLYVHGRRHHLIPSQTSHLLKLSPWEGVQHINLGRMPKVQHSLCAQMLAAFILGWQHLGVKHFILSYCLICIFQPVILLTRESLTVRCKILSHIFIQCVCMHVQLQRSQDSLSESFVSLPPPLWDLGLNSDHQV